MEEIEDKKICLDNLGDYNFLIEGDNLHSLLLLQEVYKKKIGVIYIDPPYNTGNDDFVYNDKKIDKTDMFRHSKWLSFMNRRLRIAKELLADDGVIFISIDDNEQAQLKLLCDDIFGEDNFYGELIQLKGSTHNDSKDIQKNHEYILCYTKSKVDGLLKYVNTTPQKVYEDSYILGRDTGAASTHDKLIERMNLGYSVYYIESTINGQTGNHNKLIERMNLFRERYGNFDYHISKDGKTIQHAIAIVDYNTTGLNSNSKMEDVYEDVKELVDAGYTIIRPPLRKGNILGCWTWALETFKDYWNANEVLIKDNKKIIKKHFINVDKIYKKSGKPYFNRETLLPLQSIVQITNSSGTKLLSGDGGILPGCSFNNSKSVELLRYLIGSYIHKDVLVLDFFAGSGTTGQAVLELNKEDGGNRRFILCTNNENNICENITYERLRTVITGKRKDNTVYSDGINANLKYYRCKMLNKNSDEDMFYDVKEELCHYMRPLIELETMQDYSNTDALLVLSEDDILKVLSMTDIEISKYHVLYRYLKLELESSSYSLIIERFRKLGIKIKVIDIPDRFYGKRWGIE